MKQCLNCHSNNILQGGYVLDTTNGGCAVAIAFDYKPDALLFKNTKTYKTKTSICRECGYVAQFCLELDKLNSDINFNSNK